MSKPSRIDTASARRNAQLAQIHIAAKQLGIDRDTYQAMLRRVSVTAGNRSECSSSADLDGQQRHAVVDEFVRLGAKLPPTRGTRGPVRAGQYPGKPANVANVPMLQKIEAQLASMGLAWAYADAIAKRQCGIAKVAWLRKDEHLQAIVAALDVEQTKRALETELQRLIGVLGITDKQLAHATAGMRTNWRRNRDCLHAVVEAFQARELLLTQPESPQ